MSVETALRSARTFHQLADSLSGHGLLKTPLVKVADELDHNPFLSRLLRTLPVSAAFTFGDFLNRVDLHRSLDAAMPRSLQLQSLKHWVLSAELTAVGPQQGADGLRALIRESRLELTETWSLSAFIARAPMGVTLREFLDEIETWSPEARAAVEGGVAQTAKKFASQRAAMPADLSSTLKTTGSATVDRLRLQLARARQPTLEVLPQGVASAYGSPEQRPGELVLHVHASVTSKNATIILAPSEWSESAVLRCSCGSTQPCILEMLLLDFLLMSPPQSLVWQHLIHVAVPPWERLLEALSKGPPSQGAETPAVLAFVCTGRSVKVYSQTEGKRKWSKPKEVRSATQLIPRLAGADRRFAELSEAAMSQFLELPGEALLALEGHPRVFADAGFEQPLRVVIEPITTVVEETPSGVALSLRIASGARLDPAKLNSFRLRRGRVVMQVGEGVATLCVLTPELEHLLDSVTRFGTELPKQALPALTKLLPSLEAVTTVELPEALRGDEAEAVAKVVVQVAKTGDQLVLRVLVEPLALGPLLVPGRGAPISATFDGLRRRFARRRFDLELHEAAKVVGQLGLDPSISQEPFAWQLPATDDAIETLRQLAALGEQGLQIEWPQKRPHFRAPLELKSVKLAVRKQRDWFGLEGSAESADSRVSLAQLLEAARLRRKWVRVGYNEFVTLSQTLVSALEPIAALGEADAAPTLTLGSLPLVEALSKEVGELDAAEEFMNLLTRLEKAKTRTYPVPKTVKTELRDYQLDGFRWLSRLADWGAGACLADDMGLGKTLQALALLASRSKLGPALVVAPASVVQTWVLEGARHVPSLKLNVVPGAAGALAGLKANDVAVMTWSAFARLSEAPPSLRWSTVIFDEAHAMKNASTHRAKAAHAINADFIVALTGTPVENHVGELWSLMRAVMPSLLGSQESFERRFGRQNKTSTRALAQLIRPFILRRSKSAVAKELPARTDIEVLVPLSDEEKALYDDVRLSAVAALTGAEGKGNQLKVFAALTRMRQTACHPKLVDPRWQGPTSKFTKLMELVKDLIEGEHRVLIFSQFTGHLALVAEAFRAEGLAFSYLDGQTPLAERQRQVDEFQAGRGGNAFLISLKAGGTGLTLTAADYVIHLDPWWNPAVEDQASDRAHRLGQTKPVTVYRLIAEGTVEQQILALHAEKRELVDDLLAGTDGAAKLSSAQLLTLIRGS